MSRYRSYTPNDDAPQPGTDTGWMGVNLRQDPRALPAGMAAAATNTRFRNGVPEPRGGAIKLPWTNKTAGITDRRVLPFNQLWGNVEYNDPLDFQWEVIAADGAVYKIRESNTATTIPLPARTSVTYPVWFVQCFNVLIMFRGPQLATLVLSDIGVGFQNITDGVSNFLYANTYDVNAEVIFPPNLGFAWTNAQAYAPGDIILYTDGDHYLNISSATAGQSPTTNPAKWQNLTWSPTATYMDNALCVFQATLFIAQTAVAAGLDPLNNPSVWTPVISQEYECLVDTTAGQSPTTTPASWNIVAQFIPNANYGYYFQDRLWVINGRDQIDVSNALDYVIFEQAIDALRINQGSADALVALYKYNDQTLFACKENSIYVVSNINGDLSQIYNDELTREWGLLSPRAIMAVGTDLWMLTQMGVMSYLQTELNELHGAETPKSEAVTPFFKRINGAYVGGAQMMWHDNYLYLAVPIDNGTVTSRNLVDNTQSYTQSPYTYLVGATANPIYWFKLTGLTPGAAYQITFNDTFAGAMWWNGLYAGTTAGIQSGTGSATLTAASDTITFTIQGSYVFFAAPKVGNVVSRTYQGVNNAIAVYDFMQNQWAGFDQGEAIQVQAFFRSDLAGTQRLFFLGADGYVNLYEEGTYDHVAAPTADTTQSALMPAQIVQTLTTRNYLGAAPALKRLGEVTLRVDTWWPNFTLQAIYPGMKAVDTLVASMTRSRTRYLRPFDATPYLLGNVNEDHDAPNREDYSVDLSQAATKFDSGVTIDAMQETTFRWRLRRVETGVQFLFTNTQGKAIVRTIDVEGVEAQRRNGVIA